MILNLHESVSDEMFNKVIIAYNSLKEEENLEIYLNTTGGEMNTAEAMIDFINQHSANIILIAYGEIYSAGFFIFFKANCERRIISGTMGMCHLIRTSLEYGEHSKLYYEVDRSNMRWLSSQREWTSKFYKKLGMTNKEVKKIDAGKEVYFTTKRLNELLENAGYL